jgi:TonB-linked SusC/RagA family outer membrane protein
MKNKLIRESALIRKRIFFFIMKAFLFFLCTTVFSFNTITTYSQEEVTIDNDKVVSVDDVFSLIQEQTKYRFLYPQDLFANAPKVQLKKGVIKVFKLLEYSFLGSNVKFELATDSTIVIKEKKKHINLNEIKQQTHVLGTVIDENGESLPGTNIIEKGTTNGTQSDFNGKFSLKVKNLNATLIISYLGYKTKEVSLLGKNEINIVLVEDASKLDEVVIVGYGSQKKITLTGAVSDIKTKEIQQTKTANLVNNLTGRIAGLTINNRGGEPGSEGISILIRGLGTTGNNSPLFVIDGIASRGSFSRLNPNDIESISVLKDASAAIYGAQAANGVILVTTKRGKKGKTIISFNQNYSISQPTRRPYLMNAQQYLTWVDEQNTRNGRPTEFQSIVRQYRNGTIDSSVWGDTDWWDVIMDDWTPQIQSALSVRGGNEETQFYLSGQFLDQDALYIGDAYGYKQYNIRSNLDTRLSKNFKIGFDLAARITNKNASTTNTNGLIRNTFVQEPFKFPYFENGLIASTPKGNPISRVNGDSGNNETKDKKFDSKFSFRWDLPFIIDGLYTSGYAAIDFYTSTRRNFSKPFDRYRFDEPTGEYVNLKYENGNNITLFEQYREELNKTFHMKLGYDTTFGKHAIASFIAYEQYEQKGKFFFASRQGLISENIPFLFSGSDENKNNGGSGFENARRNFFGKVNYGFDEKYLLDITVRYDGSANFAKDKRYGFFPAASIGWRISEEDFFKSKLITELKVRGSWGLLGNDRVDKFQFLQFYDIGNSYIFGEDPIRTKGLTPGTTANSNITWETSEKVNFGVDFKFKRGLLEGSIDAFYENRSDILAPRNASIPLYIGLSLPDENIGKVSNSGIEFQLNHRNTIKNVSYSLGGQFTYARSKIKFIDEPASVPEWQRRTGNPIDYLLLYQADGIYQNQDEIDNSVHFPDAKPGDVRFVDINNDNVLNQDDKIILKNSPTPKITYGITMGLEWENISLNVLFQGQAQSQTVYRPWGINQQSAFYENRWVSERTPNATYPAAYDIGSSSFQNTSTIWVKDNSFLRLKNVELSYSLKEDLLKAVGLDSFKFFITGHNLLIIYDNVKINDPESNSTTGWIYPQQKLISTGISLTF